MSSLLSYSGLSTKIRAMQSRLLTTQQYRELAELKTVPQAVAYLKQNRLIKTPGHLYPKTICTEVKSNSFW